MTRRMVMIPADELRSIVVEHRLCGPVYEGCYAHFPMNHCRADGMAWPCDVHRIAVAAGLEVDVLPDGMTDEESDALLADLQERDHQMGHG